MIKTGEQHIASLRDGREVYLDGELVTDVTIHPAYRGAVASIGFDYTAVGHEAAKQVLQIFKGAKPGDIDVVVPTVFRTVVNERAAAAMNVAVPPEVARVANVIGGKAGGGQ